MTAYLNATDVTITFALEDAEGNAIDAASAAYRVVDALGVEKVPPTSIVGFIPGSVEVSITVDGPLNAITAPRDSRLVELTLTLADFNQVVLSKIYMLEQASVLVSGENTFQSLASAYVSAAELSGLTNWSAASDQERIQALTQAWHNICQLSFRLVGGELDQGNIDYSFGGTDPVVGDLKHLSVAQFNALPARFKKALMLAQVAEADTVMGGGSYEDLRREGLMAMTVGESKQMFQSGKPLSLPVSRRTIGHLKPYVSYTLRAGR